MNWKIFAILVFCATAIGVAVSAVVISNNRAAVARANANEAEALEAEARQVARQEEEGRKAAEAAARRAEAVKATALAEAKAKESAEREAAENAKAAKLNKEAAEIRAQAAENEAKAAADRKAAVAAEAAAAKAKADEAASLARAEAEKTEAENAKLEAERLRGERIIAEAKALELRKIDFETFEQQLMEYKRELDEREKTLHPDKTSADLVWVEEREADVIGATNTVKRLKKVAPEKDMSIPAESRALAKAERIDAEQAAMRAACVSNVVVSTLERLFEAALREDRVVDAAYYRKAIRMYYPNWTYSPSAREEEMK